MIPRPSLVLFHRFSSSPYRTRERGRRPSSICKLIPSVLCPDAIHVAVRKEVVLFPVLDTNSWQSRLRICSHCLIRPAGNTSQDRFFDDDQAVKADTRDADHARYLEQQMELLAIEQDQAEAATAAAAAAVASTEPVVQPARELPNKEKPKAPAQVFWKCLLPSR